MIQKEVADRIASPPGSRTYGILSVLLQAYYDITYLFSVKPGSFFPPPKVTSGVIRLTRNHTHSLACDEALFFRVVKVTFNQRRKMIRNSLKSILVHLDNDFELLSKRPEQLGVSDFVELTAWVESRLKKS
jgi:16S rRNA (adenine1518-N6/adenine1519-N6)-dimethyltransferase